MTDPKTNPGSEEHESIEHYDLEVAPRVAEEEVARHRRSTPLSYSTNTPARGSATILPPAFSPFKSTGPDLEKILHTLEFFGTEPGYFICGYPPFLKLVLDSMLQRGFPVKDYELHGLVGGEALAGGPPAHPHP